MTALGAGTPPPVVRIVAPPAASAALPSASLPSASLPSASLPSASLLRATLVEALRRRGYRTARPNAGPRAASRSRSRAAAGSASSARSRPPSWAPSSPASNPHVDLVVALGCDDDADGALPAIELTGSEPARASSGERLATIAEAELTASLRADSRSSAVDGLAALLDARLLGGTDQAATAATRSGGGLLGGCAASRGCAGSGGRASS